MLKKPVSLLREKGPLIHCITNPISINQCANAILAVGARPIMAEHPLEVSEITATAAALMLNTGNITDVRMESMTVAARRAREENVPFMLDAVGIACSSLRRSFVMDIIEKYRPALIKGNYSEINALYNETYRSSGVDADKGLQLSYMEKIMPELAKRYNAVILASGAVDIITDGIKIWHIKNGNSRLSSITGTGCMLGALCTSYLSVLPAMEAAGTATAVLGIAGEKAAAIAKGSGSFGVELMDALSLLSDEDIEKMLSMEEINIEET